MRVVMVGPFGLHARGTMSVRALPMAKVLVDRGHTVTMLLPPWHMPEEAGTHWIEGGVSVENVELPPRIPALFHLLTAARLTRRALALTPDVIHCFKPKAYSGLTHWLLTRSPRHPRVVVDTDDWEGPGGWNALGDYSPVLRRFFAWQERWGLTHANGVTVASRTLESLTWSMGVPPARVFYVPNGVGYRPLDTQMEPSAPEVSPATAAPPVLLLYTRFFEFPPARPIEVVLEVRQRMPESRLLVVGQGFFGEEAAFLARAREAGLSVDDRSAASAEPKRELASDVTYLGWVEPDDLPRYFDRADVALYPFADTLVNRTKCAVKLVDLLAAGVPVVAEAVGQNRAYIRHGETGWLVEPGEATAFAEGVVHLLQDRSLRRRLGRAAARDVRQRFTWRRLAETVEAAYRT